MLYMVQIKVQHGDDRWGNMLSFDNKDTAYDHRDDWAVSLPGRELRVIEVSDS